MARSTDKKALTGLILVLIGAIFLIDNLGYGYIFPGWLFTWPMIFIAIAVVNAFTGNFKGALFFLLFGGFFLLQQYGLFDFKTYWPLFLVIVGLVFLIRNRDRASISADDPHALDETSIFGGSEKKFISDQFKGGKITSIFGGSSIDLRGSKPVEGASIELFTLFGGNELRIPSDWKVEIGSTAIFGAFTDSRSNVDINPIYTIKITGLIIFGGGDIKN